MMRFITHDLTIAKLYVVPGEHPGGLSVASPVVASDPTIRQAAHRDHSSDLPHATLLQFIFQVANYGCCFARAGCNRVAGLPTWSV